MVGHFLLRFNHSRASSSGSSGRSRRPWLTSCAALMVGKGRDALVFTTPGGVDVLRVSNWRKRFFAPAVAKCQKSDESCPTITPHDLRHTAASLAVSAGANVKAIQRMLGHAKASMTLDVYADLFDDDLDDVADSLDAAIKSAAAVPMRSRTAK